MPKAPMSAPSAAPVSHPPNNPKIQEPKGQCLGLDRIGGHNMVPLGQPTAT